MSVNTQSLLFNGVNQYARLNMTGSMRPTIRNLTNFTWMSFIKVGDLSISPSQKAYVELQGTANSNTKHGIRFACVPYKGKLRFEFSAKDGKNDTNYDYNLTWDERWHHVAFVGKAIGGATPTYEMYLDGTQVATGTLVVPAGTTAISDTQPLPISTGSASYIYLGAYSNHANLGTETIVNHWHGAMDDVILFNNAKNASDILGYIGRRNSWDNLDADIFSHWEFNDSSAGTALADKDNPTWTGNTYQSGALSTALWSGNRTNSNDRPYLGTATNLATGPADTTVPVFASPSTALAAFPTPSVDGTVTGTFTRATDNIFVQNYSVELATNNLFSPKTTTVLNLEAIDANLTSKSFTLTGLLPSQTYYVRVRGTDAALNPSGYSNIQSFTTPTTADLFPPDPPRNLAVSSLTSSSFTITFQAPITFTAPAVALDTVAYSADVALDSNFNNYVAEYQNRDLGAALTFNFASGEPLTRYYVRIRGRDAAGNDSASSPVLSVTTTAEADLVPPNPVNALPATSVTSRAFTANWELGIDNVGVTKYYVDVALNSTFSSFASTPLYSSLANKDVGNVTSYRFEDLLPDTIYYYRVRAIDNANNLSENLGEYMSVTTLPTALDNGGTSEIAFYPTGDANTNSAATATNYGSATTLEVAGSGAANTKNTYIQVSAAELAGSITSVMLKLWVSTLGAGAITVAVDNVTFTESTVTWATQPTVAGSTMTFTPLAANAWVEVDIGSLFIDGPTTYTIKLSTITNTTYAFHSKENTNKPLITISTDPSTGTRVDGTMSSTAISGVTYNLMPYSSFENAATTGWAAVGGTPAVISNVSAGDASSGGRALSIVAGGAVTNQGATHTNNIVDITGMDQVTALINVKWISGSTSWRFVFKYYNAALSLLGSVTTPVTISATSYVRFTQVLSAIQANYPTVKYIQFSIETNTAAASTVYLDFYSVHNNGGTTPAFFDGNTPKAVWTGTANASTAKLEAASLTLVSSYIGDSDDDNSAVLAFKKSSDYEWISSPATTTINRTTKATTTIVPPTIGLYNCIKDPLITDLVYNNPPMWINFASTTTAIETEITNGAENSLAVTPVAGLGRGVQSNDIREITVGTTVQARSEIKVPIGQQITMSVYFYTSANAFISNLSQTSSVIDGTGDWILAYCNVTVPATAAYMRLGWSTTNTGAGTFYMTRPQIATVPSTTFLRPYRDPSYDDAIWEGNTNKSYTAYVVLENTSYDFEHIYTDADGVVGGFSATQVAVAKTITTPNIPDNAATFVALSAASIGGTALQVTGSYLGDDNNDMTATVEYRRTDQATYTYANVSYNRAEKYYTSWIPGLNEGTSYTIRSTVVDPDGINGINPKTITAITTAVAALSDPVPFISFDGFVLQGRANSEIGVTSHDAFGFPNRRLNVQEYAREHGGLELSDFWGTREINMSGFVSGESRAELEANLATLKRGLATANRPLVIDTLTQYGRHYRATCTDLNIPEAGDTNYRHLLWSAKFMCADPFAYDSNLDTVSGLNLTNLGQIAILNSGDLSVFPTVTITTAHTRAITLAVENETTGERIVPFATVRSGQTIVIDNERKALYKNGVEAEYAGGFFTLAAGSNTLIFSISAESVSSETPNINVEIEWRARYL